MKQNWLTDKAGIHLTAILTVSKGVAVFVVMVYIMKIYPGYTCSSSFSHLSNCIFTTEKEAP